MTYWLKQPQINSPAFSHRHHKRGDTQERELTCPHHQERGVVEEEWLAKRTTNEKGIACHHLIVASTVRRRLVTSPRVACARISFQRVGGRASIQRYHHRSTLNGMVANQPNKHFHLRLDRLHVPVFHVEWAWFLTFQPQIKQTLTECRT